MSALLDLPAFKKADVIRQNFPKVCANCQRRYTFKSWQRLENPRPWKLPWGEVQELRECVCKSTLAIQLEVGEVDEDMGEWRSTLKPEFPR